MGLSDRQTYASSEVLTFLLDLTLEKFCQLEKTLSSSVTNCSPSITGFYWAPLCSTYSPRTWDSFTYVGYFSSACVKVTLYSDKRNTRTSFFRLPKTCQDLGDLELLFSHCHFLFTTSHSCQGISSIFQYRTVCQHIFCLGILIIIQWD